MARGRSCRIGSKAPLERQDWRPRRIDAARACRARYRPADSGRERREGGAQTGPPRAHRPRRRRDGASGRAHAAQQPAPPRRTRRGCGQGGAARRDELGTRRQVGAAPHQERVARRDLVREVQVERERRAARPVHHGGVAPGTDLAPLDLREFRLAQALGRREDADPPGRLGLEVGDKGMVRMVGDRLIEGVACAHPIAVRAEPLDRLQQATREVLGIAGERLRHRAFLHRARARLATKSTGVIGLTGARPRARPAFGLSSGAAATDRDTPIPRVGTVWDRLTRHCLIDRVRDRPPALWAIAEHPRARPA